MATIGRVVVDVDANTLKFARGIDRSTRKLERFSRRAANLARAAAGVFVTGAFASMTKETLKQVDQMGKLVDRLGGTTEAYSELQHVAELSGVAFNTLTMGLQRMTRRIGEAAEGTGEAKGAIAELGLEARALRELQIDQQFEVIADRLAGVANESDRTRLAMKLFDSEGVSLLQTMTRGAAGIREMRAEARRLGISLSRDQVDAATDAVDAMTRLGASVRGLGTAFSVQLAPWIENAVEWLEKLRGLISAGSIDDQIADVQESLDELRASQARIDAGEFDFTFGRIARDIDLYEAKLQRLIEKQRELNESQPLEIVVTYDEAAVAARRVAEQQEAINAAIEKFNAEFDRDQRLARAFESIEETNDQLDDFFREQDEKAAALAREWERLGLTFSSAFEEAIVSGRRLSDVVQGLIQDLARLATRKFITKPLFQGFLSLLDPGDGLSPIDLSTLPQRRAAGGGPISAGKPTLVGERGPEMIIPARGGHVIPNHAIGGAGGVLINNNISVEAGITAPELLAALPPILEENRMQTIAQMFEMKLDGSF